jgi:hypothetical protein
MVGRRDVYSFLEGRPLGRPGHIWDGNIIMDLQEMGRGGMNCIVLTQDRDWWHALVNAAIDLQFP